MRYAMIMAGGAGTRLWPVSRRHRPKQLIPLFGGKSLLELAMGRLDAMVPSDRRYVCAGLDHRDAVLDLLPDLDTDHYLGEPVSRDTLNAVGFAAAVIGRRDPDAVIAVFTADHIIEPADVFHRVVENGFALAESGHDTLVTFGIAPTRPATGYGYLELGESIAAEARIVSQFKEKPEAPTAQQYFDAGPSAYLWNSGMFVWRADVLIRCIKRYEPQTHNALCELADAYDTADRNDVVGRLYPTLKKISVDYALMEPASRDSTVRVAALPMPVTWLDVGAWPAIAQTCDKDEHNNAMSARQHVLLNTKNTFVVSDDPDHLIAAVGCDNLIIVHTADATLVCRADQTEQIKKLHEMVGEKFGEERL
jgi:mannose-1-phosphate guanylyltransferase